MIRKRNNASEIITAFFFSFFFAEAKNLQQKRMLEKMHGKEKIMSDKDFNLQIPQKVVPRRLWFHLLTFLDAPSLRDSFLVSKEWLKLGTDPVLYFLSKRDKVEKIKKMKAKNFVQKIHSLIVIDEELVEIGRERIGKEGVMAKLDEEFLTAIVLVFYTLKFLPILLLSFLPVFITKIELLFNLFLLLVIYSTCKEDRKKGLYANFFFSFFFLGV